MWRELRERLHPKGCEVVTVALDATGGERAERFLDRASPSHPALIDRHHESARVFGFVNVPSSVWIDEEGTIVRPAEIAPRPPIRPSPGVGPLPEGIPDRMREIADETKKIDYDTSAYHAALEDWVDKGADSRFALTPHEVLGRTGLRDSDTATAQAHFELATHLEGRGEHERAVHHFREAQRLTPDNWLFRRQAWSLEPAPNRFWQGPVPEGPEEWPYAGDWLTDVKSLGAENYYPTFEP